MYDIMLFALDCDIRNVCCKWKKKNNNDFSFYTYNTISLNYSFLNRYFFNKKRKEKVEISHSVCRNPTLAGGLVILAALSVEPNIGRVARLYNI